MSRLSRQGRRIARENAFVNLLKLLDDQELVRSIPEGLSSHVQETDLAQWRNATPSELAKGNDQYDQETVYSLIERRRPWNGQGLAS